MSIDCRREMAVAGAPRVRRRAKLMDTSGTGSGGRRPAAARDRASRPRCLNADKQQSVRHLSRNCQGSERIGSWRNGSPRGPGRRRKRLESRPRAEPPSQPGLLPVRHAAVRGNLRNPLERLGVGGRRAPPNRRLVGPSRRNNVLPRRNRFRLRRRRHKVRSQSCPGWIAPGGSSRTPSPPPRLRSIWTVEARPYVPAAPSSNRIASTTPP